MALGPKRVRFIQGPVRQDCIVHCAGGDIHAARYIRLDGGLKKLQRAGEIRTEKDRVIPVIAAPAIARPFPLDGGMHQRVHSPNKLTGGCGVAKLAWQPFKRIRDVLQPITVALGPKPAS